MIYLSIASHLSWEVSILLFCISYDLTGSAWSFRTTPIAHNSIFSNPKHLPFIYMSAAADQSSHNTMQQSAQTIATGTAKSEAKQISTGQNNFGMRNVVNDVIF